MSKAEILEALLALSPEERQEIRTKLKELDDEEWLDHGALSENERTIVAARLDEYDRRPEAGSSWDEARARIIADLHGQ